MDLISASRRAHDAGVNALAGPQAAHQREPAGRARAGGGGARRRCGRAGFALAHGVLQKFRATALRAGWVRGWVEVVKDSSTHGESADGPGPVLVVLDVRALVAKAEVLEPGVVGRVLLAGPVVPVLKLALEVCEQQRLLAARGQLPTLALGPVQRGLPGQVLGGAGQQQQVVQRLAGVVQQQAGIALALSQHDVGRGDAERGRRAGGQLGDQGAEALVLGLDGFEGEGHRWLRKNCATALRAAGQCGG